MPIFNKSDAVLMRLLVSLFLLILWAVPSAFAQAPNMYMGSEQQPIRIQTGTVFQQYADQDRRLSQITFPVSAFIPLTRGLAFSLYTNPALVSGEAVTSLQGLSDAQVALSYNQPLGDGSMVVSVGTNVPSGKRELTEAEFATTALVSQDFYGFYVPVLGQGLNISPGITLAFPFGDNMVGGLGVSYQLKGSFKPVENMPDAFKPGDEMMITGGFDFRLADEWALSTNVSYVLYNTDELGDLEVFESGNQTIAILQVLGNMGNNQARFVARYRTKAKSTLPAGNQVVTAPRTVPEQFQLLGKYNLSIQENVRATVLARVRRYNETDFFGDKTLFDIGAAPEVAFSDVVSGGMRFVYTFGSFPGVEIGAGLSFVIP